MQQPAEERLIDHIAEEAAKISGVYPRSHKKQTRARYKVLRELYGHVLGAAQPCLTDPRIFNSTLNDHKGRVEWRGGIPAGFRGLPKGDACSRLHAVWWRCIERSIDAEQSKGAHERGRYCDEQYAILLCIRPFNNMNGRTALLMRYMLRRYLDLPLEVVHYADDTALSGFVETYRLTVFLPTYRSRRFMPRT